MSALAWVIVVVIILIVILWWRGDPVKARLNELRDKFDKAIAYGQWQENMIAGRISADPVGVSTADQAKMLSLADTARQLTDSTYGIGAVIISVDDSDDKARRINIADSQLDSILALRGLIDRELASPSAHACRQW